MDYRKLKSGSDVRGVAVGEGATLTPDVAKTLCMAFARYVAGKTGKPVERVSIALGRDSRVSGPQLLEAAAQGIAGMEGTALFSLGSDGTDGPTDAAGGYVDGRTNAVLQEKGIHIADVLADNDAYHALREVDGLLMTGGSLSPEKEAQA